MGDFLVIKTYKKLWRLDYKIYALGTSLALPRPLPVRFASYLGMAAAIMSQVNKLPFMGTVPFVVKWVLIPVGIAELLDTVKLDGKNPVLFFGGCLRFMLLEKGVHLEHFREHEEKRALSVWWTAGRPGWQKGQAGTIRFMWDGGMKGGDIFV